MPRVTAEHAQARRQQILDAARVAFLRDGFHATSMQDIQRESGLSAGAIYLYFPSKNAIVAGIATEVLDTMSRAFEPAQGVAPPAGLDDLLGRVLETGDRLNETRGVFQIAIQLMAEAQRDPALLAAIQEVFATVRPRIGRALAALQQRGMIGQDVDIPSLTMAVLGLAEGYLMQRSLRFPVDRETYLRGARALMACACPPDRAS